MRSPAPGPRVSASSSVISEDPRAAGLVRYTKRLAEPAARALDRHQHRDRRSLQLTDEQRDRLADTLRLAEALGGEALTIPGVGRHIADDLISFAHANNVTQIIIGKSTRSWWFELRRGSVVQDLVRPRRQHQRQCDRRRGTRAEPVPRKTVRTAERPEPFDPVPYAIALLFVAAGLGVGELIHPWFGIEKRRPGVFDGCRRGRRPLRPVAVDVRQRRRVAVLQLLLFAADLHLHDH